MVPDSLQEMVRALQWASGPVFKLAQTGEDSDAAEVTILKNCSGGLDLMNQLVSIQPGYCSCLQGTDRQRLRCC